MELVANVSAVRQFLAYLDHLGIDERDLKVGHIDSKVRGSSAPMHVSARLIVELMEAAAAKAGRSDLGLQFVEWLNPRGFGELSLAWEHCSSLTERFRFEQRYMHIANNAVLYDLDIDEHLVTLTQAVVPALRPRAQQFLDALLALTVRTSRAMLGKSWAPVRVEFAGAVPSSTKAYRRFFRCALQFNAERHAVVILREDFERQLPQGNPEMLALIENHLARQAQVWPAELEELVQHLITLDLAGSAPTLPRIAVVLAVAPRTLQRRLAQRGTDFRSILRAVRIQIAKNYVSRTPPPRLGKLAYDLGFSEPSAACRFLKSELGFSVRQPRRQPLG